MRTFDFADGYGVLAADGLMRFVGPTGEPEIHAGGSFFVSGRGNQVVWTPHGTTAIRSFSVSAGVVDVVTLPGPRRPVIAALSDADLVWITASQEAPGLFSAAQWHWSPRSTTTSGIVVHDGPTLRSIGGESEMHVSPSWTAYDGCTDHDAGDCARTIFLWNRGTGATYEIPNRSGHVWVRVFGLTNEEVLLGEWKETPASAQAFDNLVRIKLASLDAFLAQLNK